MSKSSRKADLLILVLVVSALVGVFHIRAHRLTVIQDENQRAILNREFCQSLYVRDTVNKFYQQNARGRFSKESAFLSNLEAVKQILLEDLERKPSYWPDPVNGKTRDQLRQANGRFFNCLHQLKMARRSSPQSQWHQRQARLYLEEGWELSNLAGAQMSCIP